MVHDEVTEAVKDTVVLVNMMYRNLCIKWHLDPTWPGPRPTSKPMYDDIFLLPIHYKKVTRCVGSSLHTFTLDILKRMEALWPVV